MDKDLNDFNEHLQRLNRQLGEPLSAEEEQLLRDWAAQRPLQQTPGSEDPETLAAKGAGMYRHIAQEIAGPRRRPAVLRFLETAAIVTGIALLSAVFYWSSQRQPVRKFTVLRNETAAPRRFALPDGSVIWLNSHTSVRTDQHFGRRNRELCLDAGEAFVDVKQDEELPFLLKAGEVSVEVLGTSFNVKARPGEPVIRIAVASGSVRVNKDNRPLQQLGRDDELVYNKQYASFSMYKTEADKVSGWKNGGLFMDDVSFPEFVSALQQRYNVAIVYPQETLQQQKIHIYILPGQQLSSVLETIRSIYNIQYSISGNKVTISQDGARTAVH